VRLSELKECCRSYALTRYDASLRQLRRLGPEIDPLNEAHRAAMFVWLNAWGCRQFARAYHSMASESLTKWSAAWLARLPGPEANLTDLSPRQVALCAAAYDALRDCRASVKHRASGHAFSVSYGPTGAAKTLFAIRPNIFAPWDDRIRKARGWSPEAVSFEAYLNDTADELRRLAAEAGVSVSAVPALVGRPHSSPPKLIDEYNWVTLTMESRGRQSGG
jgi:hypothetical protein